MIVAGIDPGLTGAVAFLTGRGRNFPGLEVFDIPVLEDDNERRQVDCRKLQALLREMRADVCYFELTWAIPRNPFKGGRKMEGQGIVAAGRTQRCHGMIEAVTRLEIEKIIMVTPQVWKKRMSLVGGADAKNDSRDMIASFFPEALRFFLRKKDHNRAEAALIALYGAERQGMLDLIPD